MAHGWDSYFPNLPPRSSDPRSLRRTSESDRPLPQHIGNFIGHHDFSGAVGSREVPLPNTNFNANYCRTTSFETPRSDCVYNRYYERQWQPDRQQMGRDYPQRYRSRDFPNYASNQLPTSGSHHSSFVPDFHRPKQERDMRAMSYRGNYSATSNYSDTDSREARPSCKFTRSNFFPRPKTDIVSNESSAKLAFSTTGNRNTQAERLCPNMSETSSFSVKGYREQNHSSATSSDVSTTGNEYDRNDDAFHDQKQKVDVDRDLAEATYSDFQMTEKCFEDGNRQHPMDKEEELLKSTAPGTFDNKQNYMDDHVEKINPNEAFKNPDSTDDQDTIVNENELEKSQVLESLWEKSGSLDDELFDEKTSLIPNSSICKDEMMKTDQHERGIQKDASHPLVMNESSSSDDNDEQSESISSSNNYDIEFSLQLPEPKSCESLGRMSDDHSRDSNAGTNISQETQKDEESLSAAVEEKSTFSQDTDCCSPSETRDHSSEETSDHIKKDVASNVLLASPSSGTHKYLQKSKDLTRAEKSNLLSQDPDCIGPSANNNSSILKNSANNYKQDLIHANSCLQPSSSGPDIDPSVETESTQEKTTPILSQDSCTSNATVDSFCNDLGEEKHECIESHPDSILNNLGTDMDPVQENGSPPERKTPNCPPRQNSSPIVTSDNISVDINDTVSQAEIVLKRDSSGTDLHTDQEMGTSPDEEAPNPSSSQEFSPSVIHDNPSNDNGDIVNCSESLHKNVLNTDLFPFHSKEWASPLESTNAISRADPKCITRTMITDSNTQRDFSDLKSCSQPSAAIDVNSLLDEESISQEEITNSAFYPDPPHSINESFPSQEQTEQADFTENAKDSHEKLDLSAKALSELGLLYGEPLSGDESSCGVVETCDDSHHLQKTPVTRPDKDPMDQLERPEPQLTFSVNMRPFLHPVVILMNMESINCISNTYNCANCLHTTNSVDDLIEHHYSCHPMPSYQFCKTCNVYLKKNEQEEQHLCGQIIPRKKNNCGPYKCSRCGLLFSRILQYIRHMRDHTGRTPYQCKGCGFYFAQSSSLNHHKRVPGRCKQSLAAKKTDTVDIKTKTPTQKYVAQSTSYENMKRCYVMLIDISKTNVCNFCGKSFSSAKKTKKHIYNVHKKKNMAVLSYQSETGALYKCPLCPRHFKYSYNRARHLRFCVRNAIYGGKKKLGDKYVCPLCKAAFTATSNRYRHVKLTCLRETLNRLAREKLRLRQKCMKEKDQKPQSKEYVLLTQGKEGEAKKQGTQVSTAPIIQYKCSHCPAIFFHPSGKYRHMKKHELFKRTGKIIRYRKSAVSKPASPGGTMTKESTDTTKEFPIPTQSCRFCGLNFHVLSSLKRHERGHRGDRPYRCLECRKGFKKRTHLIGHRVVHQKRIQCTVCRKILPTIGELIQHRSAHLKKGMLQCPECQAQFQYPVYLLRHLQTHKNKDKKTKKPEDETQIKPQQSSETLKEKDRPKLLQCSLCKETFDDAQILRKHSLMHISGSSNDCPFCKKRFTTRHSLMRHMVKHTGDKPFSCADCGRQFYRSVYLKVHSETCTHAKNEQPIEANSSNPVKNKRYWCTICPRRFWTLSRLDMHLNAHKNKSLHLCTKCGQYFGVNMISRHKLVCVKTKEIPSADKSTESNSTQVSQNVQETSEHSNASKMLKLKCPYCPKRFRYRSLLLRHIVSHTGVQPFRCMHCGHRFRSQTLCLKHEASCDAGSKMNQPELKINAEADLESQKLQPEGEAELKCKFCTKTFLKARSLRHHILTHNEVKPYRCKACDSCFSRYDHLKVHQALCKSKKTRLEVRIPKICLEDVGKGWQSKFNLKPLDEQESFDCKVCLKSFPTENKLSRHTTMFHTVKPFKCSRCGSAFSHEKTLKQHQRTKRCKKARTESYTPLQQDETNQPTDKIAKQLDGIRKKILVKIQPLFNKDLKFVCSYCPRAFKNSWQLNVHNRLHTGERPYSCEHCGERFIRSDYLLRHNSKCKDKTQLSNALCDRCGGFFSEKQLEIHKKTCILGSCSPTVSKSSQSSTQPPPKGFSCAYCSSRFLIFSQLQEHFLSTHKLETGAPPVSTAPLQQLLSNIPNIKEEPVDESYEKAPGNDGDVSKPDMAPTTSDPFVCQKCNMCFINRAGLTGHQRAHETRTPFACKYCNRGFWNKTQHRNHFRKCRIVSQRLDVPVKAEIDYAFNDSKSNKDLETVATTTASAGNLQTNFPCKEEPEENSTQTSYGNVDQSSNSSTEKKAVQYQCSECDKSFTDGLLLISHLEDHGREEQEKKCNKCSKCGRMFSNQGNLRRHMKLHMIHQRYFCSLCPKVCSTLSELEKHKAGHESNKPFACKLCRQSFWTRLALCEHYSGEHGDEIFHCQWCSKVYASKKSLSRHYKKWHPKELSQFRSAHLQRGSVDQQSGSYVSTNGDSDEDLNLDSDSDSDSAPYFPCHVCGKTFPTSESLEDHQLCHLGKKPHECAECGKCFFQASQLQQHQRMHKSEFQCQTCGRGFVSLFALRNHKHSHGKSRPFRCSKCHLGFAGPTQLAEHMSTHREESFPCDICNKIFQCKSSRAEHRKSHSTSNEGTPPSVSKGEHEQPKSVFGYTTEFKYRCGICSERFRNPEQLSEHGCLEARERPYTCTECNKHFLHASHLNKHRNTHHQAWSDREYPCNQCNSSFSSSQYFLCHLKTHEGTASGIGWERDSSDGFICPVCHQCFANATELIHHFPIHPDCAPEREKVEHDTTEGELEAQEVFHPTAPAEYECGKCGGRFLGKEALHHHHCSLQQLEVVENTYFDPTDVSPGNEVAGDEEDVDVTGEDLYRCHECSMQFFSKSSLLEHQNDQHPNNWKEFKCETCGKTFAKKRYLRKHELRQHGPKEHTATTANLGKKFKCIQCRGKFFSTAQDLSNHMRLHAENQAGEYRCDMCYKSFSKRGLLKQHQESHVGEVVYECTECDKAFAFPHLLEEHQRSHTASSE